MAFTVNYQPGALKSIREHLANANGRGSDRLMGRLRDTLIEGNTRDRLRGVDAQGRPLVPWRVRKGKYKGATGPTLVPFGTRSDAIAGFRVKIYRRFGFVGERRIKVGIHSTKADIYVYHALGKSGRGRKGGVTGIRRNILGVTPKTRAALLAEFRRFAREGRNYR